VKIEESNGLLSKLKRPILSSSSNLFIKTKTYD